MKDIIKNEFNEHIKVANSLHNLTDAVAISAQLCIDCLKMVERFYYLVMEVVLLMLNTLLQN